MGDGGSAGPVRVVSEQGPTTQNQVIDYSRTDTPSAKNNVYLEGKAQAEFEKPESWKFINGERYIAWYGGKSQGSVTQWLYPSANKKVIRQGSHVRAIDGFNA